MRLRISECEDRVDRKVGKFRVEVALGISTRHGMNLSERFDIEDSDFVWRDTDHGTVLLVQLIDVKDSSASSDGGLQLPVGEERSPRARYRLERGGERCVNAACNIGSDGQGKPCESYPPMAHAIQCRRDAHLNGDMEQERRAVVCKCG